METLIDWIQQPWPWYIAGPLITFTMLFVGFYGHSFGISAALSTICAAVGGKNFSDLFNFDWKRDLWNLIFILGSIVGGFIAGYLLTAPGNIEISATVENQLRQYNIVVGQELIPQEIFNWKSLFTLKGFLMMVVGGFLVGFGTRYAGGCTSGHAITGLSNLQWPSLIAVIGFFIGGLFMVHFLLPHILSL